MTAVKFKEQNAVFAENQPEYLNLPTHKSNDGRVISCWRLTFLERMRLVFSGRIWVSLLTFNNPLQPQKLEIKSPFVL